jgi:hypothetical protein
MTPPKENPGLQLYPVCDFCPRVAPVFRLKPRRGYTELFLCLSCIKELDNAW